MEATSIVVEHPSNAYSYDGKAIISVKGGVGNYDYEWEDFSDTNDQELIRVGVGSYTVKIRDENGCQLESVVRISTKENTETDENTDVPLVSVYPVPANDLITINLDDKTIYKLNVITFYGKIIFTKTIEHSSNKIMLLNTKEWEEGNYIVLAFDKNGNKLDFQKIIIQH